jgi:hypothetical protein
MPQEEEEEVMNNIIGRRRYESINVMPILSLILSYKISFFVEK